MNANENNTRPVVIRILAVPAAPGRYQLEVNGQLENLAPIYASIDEASDEAKKIAAARFPGREVLILSDPSGAL